MRGFFKALAFRMVLRPAIVLTSAGSVSSFGATFHDLRGELKTNGSYAQRELSDINGVIYHHTATENQTFDNIAEFHTEVRKWKGIAYHYGIDADGVVYILNDPTSISYHSQGYNKHNIGVVLLGNYEKNMMPEDMIDSFIMLNEDLRDEYKLDHAWYHGQTKATACPGKYAKAAIKPYLYGDPPKR
jgi:hypothetical protein